MGAPTAAAQLSAAEAQVAYARQYNLPAFFEHLIRDCLRHRPEGTRNVLRQLRHAAERRHPEEYHSADYCGHRTNYRIGDTKWQVTGLLSEGNSSWFGGGAVVNIHTGLNRDTQQEVAIKVFQKHRLARRNQAQALALKLHMVRQLNHPHIVRLYEVVHTTARIYTVMEFAPGRMDRYIRQQTEHRHLDESGARRFFRQLLSACAFCHSFGVVHGDITLPHLLLDRENNLKLSSFGSSALTHCSGSTGGIARESWPYGSPEAFSDSMRVAPVSDAWSSGVVLFVMLTGALPFWDDRDAVLLDKIRRAEMGPAARLLPAPVRGLLRRVLVERMDARLGITGIAGDPWVAQGEEWLTGELLHGLAGSAPTRSSIPPGDGGSTPPATGTLAPPGRETLLTPSAASAASGRSGDSGAGGGGEPGAAAADGAPAHASFALLPPPNCLLGGAATPSASMTALTGGTDPLPTPHARSQQGEDGGRQSVRTPPFGAFPGASVMANAPSTRPPPPSGRTSPLPGRSPGGSRAESPAGSAAGGAAGDPLESGQAKRRRTVAREEAILEQVLTSDASFTHDRNESSSDSEVTDSDDDAGSASAGSPPAAKKPAGKKSLGGFGKPRPKLVGFGKGGLSGKKTSQQVTAFRRGSLPQPSSQNEIDRVRENKEDILDMGGMSLTEVPPAAFGFGSHLIVLDLSCNHLVEIAPEVGELAILEELRLRQNKLRTLPDAIGKLEKLQKLIVDDNELSTLPDCLAELWELEEVGIDWNRFTTFPEVVLKGGSLRHLHMVNNPLRRADTFPAAAAFGELTGQLTLGIHNAPWIVSQLAAIVADDGDDGTQGHLTINWTKTYPDLVASPPLPDKLFLGPLSCCQDPKVYVDLDIGYVASIGRELSVVLGETTVQMQLNVDDVPGTDLFSLFEKCHVFIDRAIDAGSCCLVHCFKGQSRSATIVATYLMAKLRLLRDDALAIVRASRPCINPNPGFMQQMLAYEEFLGLR